MPDSPGRSARHGVPTTHIYDPQSRQYLSPGSDPGALAKRKAGEPSGRVTTVLALCSLDSTDEEGRPNGAGRQCAQRGNLLACQLCPESPTHWRMTSPEPPGNPWSGEGSNNAERGLLTERHELDWGKDSGASWSPRPAPCILCGTRTNLRSPKGEPCHKTCAESWLAAKRAGRTLPTLEPR